MRCGVIGTGALGRGIVASLARGGYPVLVHDRDALAAAGAERAGGEAAASAGAVADEIGDEFAAGSVVVIVSTVSPETPVELGRQLAARGVDVLDCPISGGPARAEAGELAVMVGGDADALERIRPALEAIGSSVVHVGPLGHGQIAKLANNLMGAVIIEGIAEGLALAAKAGADVQRVSEAIAGGSGSSWILREWVPETVFAGDYDRRFSLDLMCKDMRIISAFAEELGVPVPGVEVARAAFERAVAQGFGNDDFSRAIQLHAEEAGADLGAPQA